MGLLRELPRQCPLPGKFFNMSRLKHRTGTAWLDDTERPLRLTGSRPRADHALRSSVCCPSEPNAGTSLPVSTWVAVNSDGATSDQNGTTKA